MASIEAELFQFFFVQLLMTDPVYGVSKRNAFHIGICGGNGGICPFSTTGSGLGCADTQTDTQTLFTLYLNYSCKGSLRSQTTCTTITTKFTKAVPLPRGPVRILRFPGPKGVLFFNYIFIAFLGRSEIWFLCTSFEYFSSALCLSFPVRILNYLFNLNLLVH